MKTVQRDFREVPGMVLPFFTEFSNSFTGSVRQVTESATPNVEIPEEVWGLED